MDAHAVQRVEPIAAIVLVVAAVVLLVIVGATAASFDGAELLGLIGLATGSVLALDAWRRSVVRTRRLVAALRTAHAEAARDAAEREDALRAAQRELEALADRAAQQAERDRDERERLQRALRRAEETGAQQRVLLRRLEQSRRAEREWNHELRSQLQDMYESSRRLADDDVRALVLRAAIQLVEAEKGILLSREDADGDGALDVVTSHGFEHDPGDSAVAQRFAHEVLALDEIVREDAPTSDVDARSPADREIDTLVAVPMYMHDRFHGVIICANRRGGFEDVDDEVLLALGDQAGATLHHGQLRNEVRDAHHGAVRALVEAMSARDPARHRETTHLATRALTLARDLSLDDWQRDVLICATLLRNVGYLALPEHALTLARPLQPNERATIELHPRLGFNIIGQVPALRDVATTTLYHHERFDGAGYPAGLTGADVPKTARALAILEAYGAMTAERPHRPKRSPDEACAELVAGAGTQFDPEITQLFVEEIRRGAGDVDESAADAIVDALPLEALREAGRELGPLAASSVDPLTLLGNQRALAEHLRHAAARSRRSVAMLLVQLEDLPQINATTGYDAGDRVIQIAARNAQRMAARYGGTAYRVSGRRFAIVTPVGDDGQEDRLLDALRTEFIAGPSIRTTLSVLRAGDFASDVLDRARRALADPV